jgi:hypothetical protein
MLLEQLERDDWKGILIDDHCLRLTLKEGMPGSLDPVGVAMRLLEGVSNPSKHAVDGRDYDLRNVSAEWALGRDVVLRGIAWASDRACDDQLLTMGLGLPLSAATRPVPLRQLADVTVSPQGDRFLVAIVARECFFLAALGRAIEVGPWSRALSEVLGTTGRVSAVRDVPGLHAFIIEFSECPLPIRLACAREQVLDMAIAL